MIGACVNGGKVMPFDGGGLAGWGNSARNQKEIRILKEMRRFYTWQGNWLRGDWYDNLGGGRAYLLGAYGRARCSLGIGGDRTLAFIHRAIREHHKDEDIVVFNDESCADFFELQETLFVALLLAKNFWPSMPPPPREPRPFNDNETLENLITYIMRLKPKTPRAVAGQLELYGV
jgi:hypothetical protein